jgi:hypothetical protein
MENDESDLIGSRTKGFQRILYFSCAPGSPERALDRSASADEGNRRQRTRDIVFPAPFGQPERTMSFMLRIALHLA